MTTLEENVTRLARPLRRAATALEVVAPVCAAVGTMAGIAIATHSQPTTGASGAARTHPWVAAGCAVVVAAILLGVLSWCVARAIGLYATDVAARHGVDVDERRPSRLPEFAQRPPRRA